jgi:dTMP kinase
MARQDTGIFIAFEGIDGAGKTTQVDLLAEFFAAAGESVVRSKEPTDGPWGQKIRKSAANGRMSLEEELAAFVEDRKEHVRDKIEPALALGRTVILDRYFYSTVAYQGSRGGDAESILRQMLAFAPEPDIVLLLDVPPEVGIARIEHDRNETPNAFESREALKIARSVFLHLVNERENIVRIDATASISVVRRTILDTLLGGVLLKRHCAKHWGCDDPFNCMYRATGTCTWAKMKKVAGSIA